ncbi:MAG: hypothetical protein Q9191_008320, partial [Dirinaria sp. TL-2023a]
MSTPSSVCDGIGDGQSCFSKKDITILITAILLFTALILGSVALQILHEKRQDRRKQAQLQADIEMANQRNIEALRSLSTQELRDQDQDGFVAERTFSVPPSYCSKDPAAQAEQQT